MSGLLLSQQFFGIWPKTQEGSSMALDAIADPVIKEKLKTETEAAIQLGVFGSPYVIVDGEPFWGFDRLEHVDRWLQHGGW